MNFLFSAPFRTNINLNTIQSVLRTEDVVQLVDKAIKDIQRSQNSSMALENCWDTTSDGELRYSSLAEDSIPLSATPLITLDIDTNVISQISENCNIYHISSLVICSSKIEYFDNTVAILSVEIEINNEECNKSLFLSIDKWSTEICKSIVEKYNPITDDIYNSFISDNHDSARQIAQKISDFKVFFDRDTGSITKENGCDVLWVTRLAFDETQEVDIELLKLWTQAQNIYDISTSIGSANVAFCIGNSACVGAVNDNEKSALMKSLSICTYFYVIYDILGRNLRSIFVSISSEKQKTGKYVKNVNKIRNHIQFIENEFNDVLLGLQGLRKIAASQWLKTWNYDALTASVQRKKESVAAAVDFAIQERQARYGRLVESFLAAIGGISLLDFSLSLFAFSNDDKIPHDSVIGLIDAARGASVNATLYALIALVFIIFFLMTKRR